MEIVFLLSLILSFEFQSTSSVSSWTQYGIVWTLLLWYLWVAVFLGRPSADSVAETKRRLTDAVENAGDTGLTFDWYKEMNKGLRHIKDIVATLMLVFVVSRVVVAFPLSPMAHMGEKLQSGWDYLNKHYENEQLFVTGLWLCGFLTYWPVGMMYVALDFWRPKCLMPYKVQEEYVLSKEDFWKCVRVAMSNWILLYFLLWGILPVYRFFGLNTAFAETLPSMSATLTQILVASSMTEIWFFSFHYACHQSDWIWNNIHYLHHEWKSPIAISAVYCHWAEMFMVNFMSEFCGPMVLGTHVAVLWLGAPLAQIQTLRNHSGWHLPFLGSPQGHDFHHSTGTDNFGFFTILDTVFGTNKKFGSSWESEIDKNYSTPDYPVDKILARKERPSVVPVD